MGSDLPLKGGSKISELQAFFWIFLSGIIIGIVFDFYRSVRVWLRWGRIATWAGDVLFSLITLVILFRFFQRANALDFRLYILWGSVLGLFVYLRLMSRLMIKMFFQLFRLISYLIWLVGEGLKIPARGLVILMRPPYALLRWFSLLNYRILESLLERPFRELRENLIHLWHHLFPPKTNG